MKMQKILSSLLQKERQRPITKEEASRLRTLLREGDYNVVQGVFDPCTLPPTT